MIFTGTQQSKHIKDSAVKGQAQNKTELFFQALSGEGEIIEKEESSALEEVLQELSKLPVEVLKGIQSKITMDKEEDEEDMALDLEEIAGIYGDELRVLTDFIKVMGNESIDDKSIKLSDALSRLQTRISTLVSMSSADLSVKTETFIHSLHSNANENAVETAIKEENSILYKQVESLLNRFSMGEDVTKISPKILKTLEKWSNLDHKSILNDELEAEESELPKRLLSFFNKRSELMEKQQYNTQAQVTNKDIAKWLKNSMKAQITVDNNSVTHQVSNNGAPLSKIEQYVVYINQSENTKEVSEQIMEKFQSVMKTSKFLSLNNGVNRLSIALRPDNLGEMMIRLTEVKGEMVLRITVTSQATKQILEANANQLKSMFSPHQIIIEEQETSVLEGQENTKEHTFQENDENQGNQSNKKQSKDTDGTTEDSFHELLMNKKV